MGLLGVKIALGGLTDFGYSLLMPVAHSVGFSDSGTLCRKIFKGDSVDVSAVTCPDCLTRIAQAKGTHMESAKIKPADRHPRELLLEHLAKELSVIEHGALIYVSVDFGNFPPRSIGDLHEAIEKTLKKMAEETGLALERSADDASGAWW